MEELMKETSIGDEKKVEEILKTAVQSTSKSKSRTTGTVGVMSVINASNGNKRITLSKGLLEKLNNPQNVKIAFTDDSVIVSERLPNNDSFLNIKVSSGKGIIYSSSLVREITEMFNLDFNNKSSITFAEAQYALNDNYTVAIIKVK